MKSHRGSAARHTRDFAIAPADTVIPTRAQCLHGSLLGREARGVTLEAVGLGVAVANLPRRVDPLEKSVPKALDGLPDTRNFSDIDARAYDHAGMNPRVKSYSRRSPR